MPQNLPLQIVTASSTETSPEREQNRPEDEPPLPRCPPSIRRRYARGAAHGSGTRNNQNTIFRESCREIRLISMGRSSDGEAARQDGSAWSQALPPQGREEDTADDRIRFPHPAPTVHSRESTSQRSERSHRPLAGLSLPPRHTTAGRSPKGHGAWEGLPSCFPFT